MKERKTELKTYMVRAYCDCGGEFKPTGMKLMINPPQYPHVCEKCGAEETFKDKYPTLQYETAGEEEEMENLIEKE